MEQRHLEVVDYQQRFLERYEIPPAELVLDEPTYRVWGYQIYDLTYGDPRLKLILTTHRGFPVVIQFDLEGDLQDLKYMPHHPYDYSPGQDMGEVLAYNWFKFLNPAETEGYPFKVSTLEGQHILERAELARSARNSQKDTGHTDPYKI